MDLHALVIEPDATDRRFLRQCLSCEGWRISEASSAEEALERLHEHEWSLVFCVADAQIQRRNESRDPTLLGTLRRTLGPKPRIVVTGAHCGSGAALKAILNGASDFIRKPCREVDVRESARAVMQRLQAAESEAIHAPIIISPQVSPTEPELIGESEPIVRVFKRLAQALMRSAPRRSNVDTKTEIGSPSPTFFITGETGTGKELVARLIHRHSNYRTGPFVPINSSALPTDLAESELFGHEPGAFTSAVKEKKGLWELADGGTLFLDEITEAPPSLLPKLLRVLQDGKVKRLGANRWVPVDVQVIAASNRDLKTEIEAKRFRRDLYHRLGLYRFHLPPLRERREDIPLLIAHFARQYSDEPVTFSKDAVDLLLRYKWPGNVRELENLVRASVMQSVDGKVYAVDVMSRLDFTDEKRPECITCDNQTTTAGETDALAAEPLEEKVRQFKLRIVKETLEKHDGNVTRTALALGITRPSLYKLLKELNHKQYKLFA